MSLKNEPEETSSKIEVEAAPIIETKEGVSKIEGEKSEKIETKMEVEESLKNEREPTQNLEKEILKKLSWRDKSKGNRLMEKISIIKKKKKKRH